jgi:hypothetical protein
MNFLAISFYLGLVLLLLCLIFLISPLREKLSTTQKIQGFGLNFEVSVLTLLFIISVGFISCGLWFQLQDISKKLVDLESGKVSAETHASDLEKQLREAKNTEIDLVIGLENVDIKKVESLLCSYSTQSSSNLDCSRDIARGSAPNEIKVTLRNLTRDTVIKSMEISDQDPPQRRWISKGGSQNIDPEFQPLQPAYIFKEVKR